MLEVCEVTKTYPGTTTPSLLPTSLRVEPGKTVVLLGPSGCGKSTLLRIIAGLVVPDAGTVHFLGEPMVAAQAERLRQRMGYVLQEGGLFPHLTAADNILLMARYLKQEVQARQDLKDLLERVRLTPEVLQRYPSELSGGQRQRVSLVRALLLKPALLLLDEPLGALDPVIRSDLQEDLKALVTSLGQSVVLVTHDLAEAAYLGDELLLMRSGAVVQRGSLHDLLHKPVEPFVSKFVHAQRGLVLSGDVS